MAPKRASVSGVKAAPAKKARTEEKPILDFIHKCDEIPKPCREMLQAAVPFCLEAPEGDRHKYHIQILARIDALLSGTEHKKREAVTTAEAEFKELEGEKGKVNADSEAKRSVSDSKKAECDEKSKVVDAAREVMNEAKAALKAAQDAEAEFNTKKEGLHGEQESFSKLMCESFQPLKDGTLGGNWQTKKKCVAELKKQLMGLGAQESLGDALAATLKMTPEKREGTFAKATMQFAEEYFTKHTAKLAQDIAGLDAEAASHAAGIAADDAKLAEKKGAYELVEKEWDTMQDAWLALEKDAAEANKTLHQIEARIPRATKTIDKSKDALEKFLEIPAQFAVLKNPPKVVEEEAVAEEAMEVENQDAGEA